MLARKNGTRINASVRDSLDLNPHPSQKKQRGRMGHPPRGIWISLTARAKSRSLPASRARQTAAGKKKRGTSFGMTRKVCCAREQLMQRRGGPAFWWALHYEAEGGEAGDDYCEAGDYVCVGQRGSLLREKSCCAGIGVVRSIGWAHALAAESGG